MKVGSTIWQMAVCAGELMREWGAGDCDWQEVTREWVVDEHEWFRLGKQENRKTNKSNPTEVSTVGEQQFLCLCLTHSYVNKLHVSVGAQVHSHNTTG